MEVDGENRPNHLSKKFSSLVKVREESLKISKSMTLNAPAAFGSPAKLELPAKENKSSKVMVDTHGSHVSESNFRMSVGRSMTSYGFD